MTNIYITVHPVSHRHEWRGWGGKGHDVDKPKILIEYD